MKNNKGFSMVELIIVIAIMAILVGAIAPTLLKYIKKSRKSADLDNADILADAVQVALVEKTVDDYIITSGLPYTIDTDNLRSAANSGNVFAEYILKTIGGQPKIKYKSNGATTFEIVVADLDGSSTDTDTTSYIVQILAKGATVTSTSGAAASPVVNDGAMLWPEPDAVYNSN